MRFGDFELLVGTAELRRSGRAVKLQQQPCKVLGILAAHPGELVTREELRQEIWPNGTFVDFEHGINFCIKQIRSALGDDAQSPTYIETLPRRGYRFIAPVEILNGGSAEPVPSAAAQLPAGQETETSDPADGSISGPRADASPAANRPWSGISSPWSKTDYAAGLLLLAAVLVAGAYLALRPRSHVVVPASGRIVLAVIPFEYIGSDPDQQFFADGLTEEMIMQVGSLEPRRLGVIGRTSALRYRDGEPNRDKTVPSVQQPSPDLKGISKDLGVDFIVEGSVRMEADRIEITARLIKSSDLTLVWSDSYDTARSGVSDVQKSMAARIAGALAIELLPATKTRATAGATVDAQAHEWYLRGQYLKNKGDRTSLERSADYFKQAVARDPNYGAAYSGLADSYRFLALAGAAPAVEVFPESRAAASRALALDEASPEGHSAMGSVKLWFERSLPEAEREFKRAIELNPSYGWARHDYAWLLVASGRFDEAVYQVKQAQALDPLSPLANSDVGWVYLFARRYDEAIDQIKRTLDLEPRFGSARACLIQAYLYKGMIKEALVQGREEMARGGASLRELQSIDAADTSAALRNYLRWTLEKSRKVSGDATASRYRMAQLYAELSENDLALVSLAEAFSAHDPMLIFLNVDPAFDGLRSDPRFVALVDRAGLSS